MQGALRLQPSTEACTRMRHQMCRKPQHSSNQPPTSDYVIQPVCVSVCLADRLTACLPPPPHPTPPPTPSRFTGGGAEDSYGGSGHSGGGASSAGGAAPRAGSGGSRRTGGTSRLQQQHGVAMPPGTHRCV
jgi:hypothetical protein